MRNNKLSVRKYFSLAVILTMIISLVPSSVFAGTVPPDAYEVDQEWYNLKNNQENNGITDRPTPIDSKTASLKWGEKYGTGWGAAPTPPLILDGFLYIGVGNKIIKLDKESGQKLAESDEMIGNVGYAMNPLIYADGMIFAQVGNGVIQAVDLKTLKCVWYTERIGGQTVSPISYLKAKDGKGYVYTGTWNGENRDGYYICATTGKDDNVLDENQNGKGGYRKKLTWKFQPSGRDKDEKGNDNLTFDEDLNNTLNEEKNVAKRGFYWAGAYTSENFIAVGSDDGTREGDYSANAVFYTLNPTTGEIIDKVSGIKGDIRTTTVYDNGYLYFSTKGGQLHKISVDENGKLGADSHIDLGGMTTASPVVYGNKIYIGVCGAGGQFDPDGGHGFAVVDNSKEALNSSSELYRIPIKGYPQASAIVSTAYVDKDFNEDGTADGRVYIYFTYNANPGGIYYTYDTKDQKEASKESKELFVPEKEMQQYCISTICADREGTLYYKNDSCYLMAVETNNAFVSDMKITDDTGKLASWDKGFDQTITKYDVKVSKNAKSVNLELNAPDDVELLVNGKPYSKGMKVDLNGESTDLSVIAKIGEFKKIYKVNVSKLSTDVTLSELKVNDTNTPSQPGLSMTPEFSKGVKDYTVDVTDKTPKTNFWRIWPKAENKGTNISVVGIDNVDKINDNYVNDGYFGVYPKDLSKTTKVKIIVTSESGDETGEYNITLLKKVKATGIKLDRDTLELDITDEPSKLTAIVVPDDTTDKSVTWSASPEEIASVSEDGTVTPKKVGEANIAAISVSNPNLIANCKIKITDKAAEVDAKIEKIGKVTLESKADIDAARASYEALNEKQQKRVTKLETLKAAEAEYKVLKDKADKEEADKLAAKAVIDKINAIGSDVTLENRQAVLDARAAYEGLTADQKKLVSEEKLNVLVKAEEKIAELEFAKTKDDAKAEIEKYKDLALYREAQQNELKDIIKNAKAAIDDAKDADGLKKAVDSAKAEMDKVKTDAQLTAEEEAKKAAAEVDKLIDSIGKVEFTVESREKIKDARAAYNGLSDQAKGYVNNIAALEKAENDYAQLTEDRPIVELKDEKTGIVVAGKFMDRAKLKVEVMDKKAEAALKDSFKGENVVLEEYLGSYDVSIEGGYEGQLNVTFTVGNEYDGKTVMIKHLNNKGKIETFAVKVVDGKATITVDSLSPFMLAHVSEKVTGNDNTGSTGTAGNNGSNNGNTTGKTPQTGDDTNLSLWITLFAIGGLATIIARRAKSDR